MMMTTNTGNGGVDGSGDDDGANNFFRTSQTAISFRRLLVLSCLVVLTLEKTQNFFYYRLIKRQTTYTISHGLKS